MTITTKAVMTAVNQIADKIGNNKSNKKGFIIGIATLLLFVIFVVILAVMVIFAPISWFLNLIGVLDFRVSKSDIIKYADTPKIECIQCVSDIVYPTTTEDTLIKADNYTVFDNAENSEVVAIYDGIVKDLGFNENGRYIVMEYTILMQEDNLNTYEDSSDTEKQEDIKTDNNINNENGTDVDIDNNIIDNEDETETDTEEKVPVYYFLNIELMYEGILQNYTIRGNEAKRGQIIATAKEKSLKVTVLNENRYPI